jgi:hypothetical protein
MSGIFRSRIWLSGIVLVALALAMLAVVSHWPSIQPARQDPSKAQAVKSGLGSDGAKSQEASLQELAERLLGGSNGGQGKAELMPGKLPDDLPFSLPALDGWRTVGSVVFKSSESGMPDFWHSTVVLDAPGDPSVAYTAIQTGLEQQGWKIDEVDMFSNHDSGGFLSSGEFPNMFSNRTDFPDGVGYHMLELCRDAKAIMLNIQTNKVDSGTAGLNLSVESFGSMMPCGSFARRSSGSDAAKMPNLTAPEGVQVMGGGGSSGGSSSSSEGFAKTDKSAGFLEAHYAKQLEAAGWTRQDGKDAGPLAWSLWKVPGKDDTQGFLYVLEMPGGKVRTLTLRVDNAADMSVYSSFSEKPSIFVVDPDK